MPATILRPLLSLMVLLSTLFLAGRDLAARELVLTTENYPPFNMQDEATKRVIGISTDIVREMMKRAKEGYTIKFLPWQRAYAMALKEEGTCVFSTTETTERLPLFKWVGPLVQNNWTFFGREDSDISIEGLDDARGYVVGGYKGDATALYLEREGFTLDLASHDRLNPAKLAAERFDLWATGGYLGPYLAREVGVAIKPIYSFQEVELSLACNKNVPDSLIDRLNAVLEAMRADGTVAALTLRYNE